MTDRREWCIALKTAIESSHLSLANAATALGVSKTSLHRLLSAPDSVSARQVESLQAVAFDRLFRYLIGDGHSPDAAADFLKPIKKEFETMIADRCQLTPEALRFFSLNYDPFDADRLPTEQDLYLNKDLTAVINRVRDAVIYQRFVAVVGEVGSGKTLVKRMVADELAAAGRAIIVYPEFFDMSEITVSHIATQILTSLGQSVPRDKVRKVTRIREVLSGYQQEGVSVALVIDEAHRLSDAVISSLKNFWELTNGKSARLLGVLLFGQPQLVEARLRDIAFREIRQRVQVVRMPAFNRTAGDYILHRIAAAGGNGEKIFDTKAIQKLAANATTPLALGNLAAAAMMSAYAVDESRVTPDLPFFQTLPSRPAVLQVRRVGGAG